MRSAILFSGIGGWEHACEASGIEVAWACEWDDWKRSRYRDEWPGTPLSGDVKEIDGTEMLRRHGPIDLLLGSPPCTDISAANVNGHGVDGVESRLFFEAVRLVREIRPRWCCFENSPRLRTRGADRVLGALGEAGYTSWPLVVEAEDAGAPHERGRVYLVAAETERLLLRKQPGRGSGTDGQGASVDRAHAHAYGEGQSDCTIHGEMGWRAGIEEASRGRLRAPADLHGEPRRPGTGRSDGSQARYGSEPTPCHSASRGRSEWQGVGGDHGSQLAPIERAIASPWDHAGDSLAGYLRVADGLAARLSRQGLSGRKVKSELARWRSALGDALVIPVVTAVVRAIIAADLSAQEGEA